MPKLKNSPRQIESELASDMLYGIAEISSYLGMESRSTNHLAATNRLPVFKIGAMFCARKSTLLKHIETLEAAASAQLKSVDDGAATVDR